MSHTSSLLATRSLISAGEGEQSDEVPRDVLPLLALGPPVELLLHHAHGELLHHFLQGAVPGQHAAVLHGFSVDGQVYHLNLFVCPGRSPAAATAASGRRRTGQTPALLAATSDGWRQNCVESREDVVCEHPALWLVHPQPLPHGVIYVQLEELIRPRKHVLQ